MPRALVILAILGSSVLSAAAWGEQAARDAAGAPAGQMLDPAGLRRSAEAAPSVQAILKQLDLPRGLCALVGDRQAELAIQIARASELQVYLQLAEAKDVEAARRAADAAGMLNHRVYADRGSDGRIHLADNLADAVVVCGTPRASPAKEEVLRVLRPGGTAWLGAETLTKPVPPGIDQWTHPYHGPDNNPQSADQVARAPYLTQFLAEPYYGPMPEMTVASGGRIFKAFGSRAFLRPQWPVPNTLIAMNGYNGTLLWQRPLDPDFMMHRNTLIAAPDTLYLADQVSCKLLDAATGRLRDEIRVPEGISDGPGWKWMALPGARSTPWWARTSRRETPSKARGSAAPDGPGGRSRGTAGASAAQGDATCVTP